VDDGVPCPRSFVAPYPTHVVTFAAVNGLGRRGQPGQLRLTPAEWAGILPDLPYIDSCS
jgi:hypothetical protein